MRTNKLHSEYNYRSYKGRLANEQIRINGSNGKTDIHLFVFTGISSKRLVTKREAVIRDYTKVIFITNKQLMDENNKWFDYGFFSDIRQLIDSKAGTRYHTRSSIGSYQFCRRKGVIPTPITKHNSLEITSKGNYC